MSLVHILPNLRKGLSTNIAEGVRDEAGLRAMFPVNVWIDGHQVGTEEGKMTTIPGEEGQSPSLTRSFPIAGPVDVRSISTDAICQAVPEDNSVGYSKDYMPYIEFYEEDFPWRYTPLPSSEKLIPWLMLLACKDGEFTVSSNASGEKRVEIHLDSPEDAKKFYPDTEKFYKLAHVQITTDGNIDRDLQRILNYVAENPDNGVSRLFCPRILEEKTRYTMFLVPAFELGRLAGLEEEVSGDVGLETLSWDSATQTKTFPVYYQWSFTTGKESFMTLAEKQKFISGAEFAALPAALKADISETGLRRYRIVKPNADDKTPIDIPCALVKKGFTESSLHREDASMVQELKNDLLLKSPAFRDVDEDTPEHPVYEDPWIVPPVYGARHILAKPSDLDNDRLFLKDLNLRFSNRAAAGMGVKVVKKNQDMFMNRAWGMVEEVNALNQRIREFYQVLKTNGAADEKTTSLRYYNFPTSVLGLQADAAIRIANAQSAGDINAVDLASDITGQKLNVMHSAMGDYAQASGVSMDELGELMIVANWESVKKDIVTKGHPYQFFSGELDFFDEIENGRYSIAHDLISLKYPKIEFVKNGVNVNTVVTPVTEKDVLLFHALASKTNIAPIKDMGLSTCYTLTGWLGDTYLYDYSKLAATNSRTSLPSLNSSLQEAFKEYENSWGEGKLELSPFLPATAVFGSFSNLEATGLTDKFAGTEDSCGRFVKQKVYDSLFPDYPNGFAFQVERNDNTLSLFFLFPESKLYDKGNRYFRFYSNYYSDPATFDVSTQKWGALQLYLSQTEEKVFRAGGETHLSPHVNDNYFHPIKHATVNQVNASRSAVLIRKAYENWPESCPEIAEMRYHWDYGDKYDSVSADYREPTYILFYARNNTFYISYSQNGLFLIGDRIETTLTDRSNYLQKGVTIVKIADNDSSIQSYSWLENGIYKVNLKKVRELLKSTYYKVLKADRLFWRPNIVCMNDIPDVPILRADDLAGIKGAEDVRKQVDTFYDSIINQVMTLTSALNKEQWTISQQELADESKKATPQEIRVVDADQVNRDRLVTIAKELSGRKMTMDLMESNFDGKYPVMAAPLFPDPTSFYLRELSEKYLLPSVDELKMNSISCFVTNPAFEEAFLAGMNTEMGRELLWREYPTDERGSCFRKFWDQNDLPEDFGKGYFDVQYLHNWKGRLGENHEAGKGRMTVFVIKSELITMYPQTSVCLAVPRTAEEGGEYLEKVLDPVMTGWLANDTFMAGFDSTQLPTTEGIFLTFVETDKSQRFFHGYIGKAKDVLSSEFAVNRSDSGSVWGVEVHPDYLTL